MPKLLIQRQEYLETGIHIGTKQKTKDMKEFIYKIRPDGLSIMNLKKTDNRIRVAARFLSRMKNILIASRKQVHRKAVKKFVEIVGGKAIIGRFIPGMLTNPSLEDFYEADVVFVLDPVADIRAIEEAIKARVPIIAVCNTGNETKHVDLIIPANNKAKKSVALILWLLAREIQKERGLIKSNNEFKYTVNDFL